MESEIPDNAPSSCPGVSNLAAGTASGCSGCPNQSLCSSGAATQTNEEISNMIKYRFRNIKNVIVIVSGKGGVGKSSVVASLAYGLSNCMPDKSIGVLDLDITGPSVPTMLGCSAMDVHKSASGWSPVQVSGNLSTISIGFMLESPDQPIIWRDPRKSKMISQMLTDVNWSDEDDEEHIDYLIIDTPPGTCGEHMALISLLKSGGIFDRASAILVSTPQIVAVSDVQKQLTFLRKVGFRVSGVVENMSEYKCRKCKHEFKIFNGGKAVENLCSRENLPLISRIPLDKGVTQCLDRGCNMFEELDEADHDVVLPQESTLSEIEKMVAWVRLNIRNDNLNL